MPRTFDEGYFSGVSSGYKYGYTWKTIGYLLRSQFRMTIKHSRFKSGRWLDIGCAKGLLLKLVSQSGWEPFGFDISTYAVEEAHKVCPEAHLLVLNADYPLPFSEDFFEVVTAFEVIEHLKRPQPFLGEVYRVLRRGGIFFLTTPNVSSVFSSLLARKICKAVSYSTPFHDETHISYFDSKTLEEALRQRGFRDIKISYSWDALWRLHFQAPKRLGWTLEAIAYR